MKTPLAERIRPETLEEFIGQTHIIGPGKMLTNLINQDRIPSLILWGPPGTGKTTLARVIAKTTKSEFVQLSAVLSGVKDIRATVETAKQKQTSLNSQQTILFIDEIHRFNKSQQDSLLPHVENGTITLIGATTENPSFEVNAALLSRSRVIVLKTLTIEDLLIILNRAKTDPARGLGWLKLNINSDNLKLIAELANGDARSALNIFELATQLSIGRQSTSETDTEQTYEISQADIISAVQKEQLYYDQTGEEHYNTISAFIKSMRASDVNAAIYYLTRMIEAGEDPLYIARRMVIFASEDIGMANPNALLLANEVFKACEIIGYPECAINLAHGVAYLANSAKNRSAYNALQAAKEDVQKYGNLPIPLKLRNAPTKLMKKLEYGKNYQMYDTNSLLPEKLHNKKYFQK